VLSSNMLCAGEMIRAIVVKEAEQAIAERGREE
jgi:hypothetical protein